MSSNPRLPGVVIEKPFMYGSAAFAREDRTDENTHRWTVFLRGVDNEDLSTYIKEVQFQLHDSFRDPIRSIRSPPYEVTEFGWGEFMINITVHFHPDSGEKPVTIQQYLKLFPENKSTVIPKNTPLLIEKYDEFVFSSPTTRFLQLLKLPPPRHFTDHPLNPFFTLQALRESEARYSKQLTSANQYVKTSIEQLQAKLLEVETQIQKMSANNMQ